MNYKVGTNRNVGVFNLDEKLDILDKKVNFNGNFNTNLNLTEKIISSNSLNNLNELDEIDVEHEKIIIPKKNFYCSNCNRKGHFYKNCTEPIISNGIIGIYIENFNKKLFPLMENYLVDNLKIFKDRNSPTNKNKLNTWLDNNSKIRNSELNPKIKFLMIQRKKSLGYLEFIRGRYSLDDPTGIYHLMEQMTPQELADIENRDFDYLWSNLWDEKNIRNKNHHKEYIVSKQKFYQLKLNKMDLIKSVKPLFTFNEWGFPKGRREAYESDLVCALREFEEETDYKDNQYSVLEECKSIRENLVGTNGINYAHNYFLTILHEINEFHDESNREIGNIKVMNINECLEVIRPYHKNKIKIIKNIYTVLNNFFKEYGHIDL